MKYDRVHIFFIRKNTQARWEAATWVPSLDPPLLEKRLNQINKLPTLPYAITLAFVSYICETMGTLLIDRLKSM